MSSCCCYRFSSECYPGFHEIQEKFSRQCYPRMQPVCSSLTDSLLLSLPRSRFQESRITLLPTKGNTTSLARNRNFTIVWKYCQLLRPQTSRLFYMPRHVVPSDLAVCSMMVALPSFSRGLSSLRIDKANGCLQDLLYLCYKINLNSNKNKKQKQNNTCSPWSAKTVICRLIFSLGTRKIYENVHQQTEAQANFIDGNLSTRASSYELG